MKELCTAVQDWMFDVSETLVASPIVDFTDDEALTIDTDCTTGDHRYCIDCMKHLFLRASKEEAYYPPRCCRQPLPLALIEKHMTVREIEAFNSARRPIVLALICYPVWLFS
jgi:hypothetical protein